jgi:hypothetical protein
MIVNTAKGDVLIEKNEVIYICKVKGIKDPKNEKIRITNFPSTTINELLNKARQRMGDNKCFERSANNNNCQDYILNILKANNIYGATNFIKQNTESIFENHPEIRKGINTVTDLAGRLDVIKEGNGIGKLALN